MGILDAPALTRTTGVAKPTARKAYFPIGAPNLNNAAAFDYAYRTIARLGRATGRWRVGFANRNLRSTATLTTPVTITGVFFGDPVYGTTAASGARWTGAATGALTSISGALTVPTDGSAVMTPWVTDAGKQFAPAVAKVVGWGHSNANTGSGVAYGDSVQFYRAAGNGNAANAVLTAPTLTTQGLLDVWIEYEFTDAGQIMVVTSDSNGIGYTPSGPSLFGASGAGALAHEAWPAVAGDLGGFATINLSVGSTTIAEFAGAVPRLMSRFDLSQVAIDVAVAALGTNGLAGASFNAFVSDFLLINSQFRVLGAKRIYWTEIPPRALTTMYSPLAATTTAGATTFQTTTALVLDGTNGVVVGSDTFAEDVVVTGAPTGSGPFTYTIAASGTLMNAHAAGESTSSSQERARRRQNAWLRGLPDGISGLIPFEKALEKSPESPLCDPRIVALDGYHFVRAASANRAAPVAIAAIQPKLS